MDTIISPSITEKSTSLSEFNKVVEGEPGPFFQKALARAKKFGLKVNEPKRECDDKNCPFHGGLSIRDYD